MSRKWDTNATGSCAGVRGSGTPERQEHALHIEGLMFFRAEDELFVSLTFQFLLPKGIE